jgi:WxL interacting protein linking bacterial and host surfaces
VTRALGLVLLAACCFATRALAGGSSFAVRPVTYTPSNPVTQSYFVIAVRPGEVIHSQLRVTNAGTATGTALLYGVDATTGATSGAVYLSRTTRRRDVGGWLRLGAARVTLAPGESRVVPFALVVPAHVRSGDHLGGIVAENLAVDGSKAASGKTGGSFRIRVRHLTIVAVQLALPGPRIEKFALTGVTFGRIGAYPTLLLNVRNSGTVMLKPRVTVHLTNAKGMVVERRTVRLDTFLPRTAIAYPLLLHENLAPGTYHAAVQIAYGTHVLRVAKAVMVARANAVVRSTAPPPPAPLADRRKASRLPWLVALAGAALGLVGAAAALRARRRM